VWSNTSNHRLVAVYDNVANMYVVPKERDHGEVTEEVTMYKSHGVEQHKQPRVASCVKKVHDNVVNMYVVPKEMDHGEVTEEVTMYKSQEGPDKHPVIVKGCSGRKSLQCVL
jgi:hypothetical protein